jgi:riboflavin biosynthesis pyrimidine reductase
VPLCQLLPTPLDEVDAADVYTTPAEARSRPAPWVLANMVSSADGSAAVQGRSGPLGGEPDARVFRVLRRSADVVLAGAGTVRTEGYRPIRGDSPTPIAVVSASLDLDLGSTLFTEALARTIVVTCATSDAGRRAAAEEVADVVVAGEERVDAAATIAALAERGHRRVLCEGGPSLLAQLVAADMLDELCLTIAPTLAGGDGPRILTGATWAKPLPRRLATLLEEDGVLFARYLRA